MIDPRARGTLQKMRSPRFPLTLACFVLSSALGACAGGTAEVYCAAIGDEVLPELELVAFASQVDCTEGAGWTAQVERHEDELSVEVGRSSSFEVPLLRARAGGLVAFVDDELLGLDRSGEVEWRTPYTDGLRLEHGTFAVGGDDRIYISDTFGQDAKIVVFEGSTGVQVRQFLIEHSDQGGFPPVLAPRGEQLWLTRVTGESGFEGFYVSSYLERYSFEGQVESSLEFEHGEFEHPAQMVWTEDGQLAVVSWGSVYMLDPDSGAQSWQFADTPEFDFVQWRAITATADAVVTAHGRRSNDGGPNTWVIAAYEQGSGTQLWTREFAGSGQGQELGLTTLASGEIAFVGGEFWGPDQSQPMIVILDGSGEPVAGERLAVEGAGSSVVADAGKMFVLGGTGTTETWQADYERIYWLRRYAQ